MGKSNFSKKIINWYLDHLRDLPWRRTKDPYRIWLSEVILQQTRVTQGLPYYKQFIKAFPNIDVLAKASEQKILRAWQGLGYYSRARNLHACAKEISTIHKSKFPRTYDELIKLPGIGPYTGAAIASIAFDQPLAVVDGNVYRVLSRVFGIENDITSADGKQVFSLKAQELIDKNQPGIYNQAVMEFGALHCVPKNPNCSACIFSRGCFANRNQLQHALPYKSKRVKVRNRYFTYFVLSIGNKLALRKRGAKDIWSGLYDFYLVERRSTQTTKDIVEKDPLLKSLYKFATVKTEKGVVKHVLTHQKIYAKFITLSLPKNSKGVHLLRNSDLKFYSIKQINVLPKPVLISNFLTKNGILE